MQDFSGYSRTVVYTHCEVIPGGTPILSKEILSQKALYRLRRIPAAIHFHAAENRPLHLFLFYAFQKRD